MRAAVRSYARVSIRYSARPKLFRGLQIGVKFGISIENMTSAATVTLATSEVTADSKLAVLQYGRALAAISVVLSHAALATNTFVDRVPWSLNEILTCGYLGVDFFFYALRLHHNAYAP